MKQSASLNKHQLKPTKLCEIKDTEVTSTSTEEIIKIEAPQRGGGRNLEECLTLVYRHSKKACNANLNTTAAGSHYTMTEEFHTLVDYMKEFDTVNHRNL